MLTTEIFDVSDLELKILSFVEDIKYHLGAKQNLLPDFSTLCRLRFLLLLMEILLRTNINKNVHMYVQCAL
jgi:hypothetical protein